MTEVISVKFKNRGKSYFFDPCGLEIHPGDKVIVETSKGLEMADCVREPHAVTDESVVPPLRPVVRVATADDLRVAERNSSREKDAFEICKQKIAEHKLDMKLIDAECNFEGNKTTFYFTSDGRVDFRELVKDLAGIFRNRIELRQIGVRDEAKMLGGIGMCGRPYCCHQFMDDFKPVSTKMAKVQNLSLNPTKISGSCGRLMCCLRYEQDAYEDLNSKVPHQGAFVETIEGYGTAVQVNLLRQQVKVRLDTDKDDDSLHVFRACEVAAVPGGRPKEGEPLPSVLNYVPEQEEEFTLENKRSYDLSMAQYTTVEASKTESNDDSEETAATPNRRRRNRRKVAVKKQNDGEKAEQTIEKAAGETAVKVEVHRRKNNGGKGQPKKKESPSAELKQPQQPKQGKQSKANEEKGENQGGSGGNRRRNYRYGHRRHSGKKAASKPTES